MSELDRGTVRIKPVYVGLPHYYDVYGSVCSPDVKGTPSFEPPTAEDVHASAQSMVDGFAEELPVDFVEIDEPLVVEHERDMRRLPAELTYDVDGLLVRTLGRRPWEPFTLSQYGLPVIGGPVSGDFLRGLRAKKYLSQSRFLYIGEIPSFSAPDGPYDFQMIEERLGVAVRHIETNEFFRHFDALDEDTVTDELDDWSEQFAEVEPDRESMLDATRVYLALRELCEREDANGVTINCGRFTEERPVVPCLAFDRLIDEGIMCACEGDITAMLSSLLLHAVSEQPVLMGNFGYRKGMFEAESGEVTIEHDLIPLSMASGAYTVRDYHTRNFGVTAYADIRQEPMTLLNIRSSLDSIVAIEGHINGSEDGGHCRIIIHMSVDGDVNELSRALVGSQHMSMAFGHWKHALTEAAEVLDMEARHLKAAEDATVTG
jgi:L-fucose isomerase-like protein